MRFELQRGCIRLLYSRIIINNNVAYNHVFTKPASKATLIKFHLLEVIEILVCMYGT